MITPEMVRLTGPEWEKYLLTDRWKRLAAVVDAQLLAHNASGKLEKGVELQLAAPEEDAATRRALTYWAAFVYSEEGWRCSVVERNEAWFLSIGFREEKEVLP